MALPTETVYGLGADAQNDHAVARIFEAKARPSFNPLIVHVADTACAERLVQWTSQARQLAEAFWPGPLTLVLPLKPGHGLSPLVTAGLDTVAIRIPAHEVAQTLLSSLASPLAAPSANPSGLISPTTSAHVMAGLSGRIDAVLEGGPCTIGLESTIVSLEAAPTLLRPGGVPLEAIEAVLDTGLVLPQDSDTITSPGQMRSHYAPGVPLRCDAAQRQADEVLLGFGPVSADLNLSPSGDLLEAAANLFGHLHALDATGKPIAVSPIPETGLGRAINDRLRRAAAPKPG